MTLPGQSIYPALSDSHPTVWSVGTTYQPGMVVWDNGAAWVATATNKNSEPTSVNPNWIQVSASGGGGGGTGVSIWNALTTYAIGNVVIDRGGTWIATAASLNSRPISGNANWTLVGGTPYVEITVDPVGFTTPPFFSNTGSGPLLVLVPAPGAGKGLLPVGFISYTHPGDPWPVDCNPEVHWGNGGPADQLSPAFAGTTGLADPMQDLLAENLSITSPVLFGLYGIGYNTPGFQGPGVENVALTIGTNVDITSGGAGFGTRSCTYRLYYTIILVPLVPTPQPFFHITAVNQGLKTFTVTDTAAALNGATGTFAVVGSTGNNGTYTIVSAVSGAGSTVITVVQAIPSAVADGWVRR